jgi:TnpA family transposase
VIIHVARARLRAFYGVLASLRDRSKNVCRSTILAGTGGLKAAFFGYFLCGGKESNCRPAQGQRMNKENKMRMPAKVKKEIAPRISANKTNPKTKPKIKP